MAGIELTEGGCLGTSPLVEAAGSLGGVCDDDALGDRRAEHAQPSGLGGLVQLVQPGLSADGVLLVLFIPTTVSVWGMILRRSARYYMSPERNAVLAIVAKRGAWHIADHVAAEPSHDQGKALRERLIGPLTIAADRAGVEIRTVAANQKLADQYVAEVQGLVDVGPGMPRGRKLQRPPAQDARTNLQ